MPVPDVSDADGEPASADPVRILGQVAPDAQLLLRDYIAGLEAQTGSARAEADRQRRARVADTDHLRLQLAGARSERDAALAELDAARRTINQLSGRHSFLKRVYRRVAR
jgi:chromosome segregation ATPase